MTIEQLGFENAMSPRLHFRAGTVAVSTLAFVFAGCGSAPDAASATTKDPVNEVPKALGSSDFLVGAQIGEYSDWSGTVSVRVYECAEEFGNRVLSSCATPTSDYDAGYRVVGGGGLINPGASCALLTGSAPNGPFMWNVQSKDHGFSCYHSLRGYVIAMRLEGVADLMPEVTVSLPDRWSATAPVPEDHILVGGGAWVAIYDGPGLLLTGSTVGSTPVFWSAGAEQNQFPDPTAAIRTFAISVPRCPPGFGGCLKNHDFFEYGGTGGGFQSALVTTRIGLGYATTSIGGYAGGKVINSRRYLTALFPNWEGGAEVWSTDHVIPESGRPNISILAIARE